MYERLSAVLDSPISRLSGVGNVRLAALKKLGCETIGDILYHIPSSYLIRNRTDKNNLMLDGQVCTFIFNPEEVRINKIGKPALKAIGRVNDKLVSIVYFRSPPPFVVQAFEKKEPLAISGIVKYAFSGRNVAIEVAHPDYVLNAADIEKIPQIEAVYPLSAGLSSKVIAKLVSEAFHYFPKSPETLPEWVINQYGFQSLRDTLYKLHKLSFETFDTQAQEALITRLAFEEMLVRFCKLQELKRKIRSTAKDPLIFDGKLKAQVLSNLGFTLTDAQNKVLLEIEDDQRQAIRGFRLIQGDVGCGKTIVALSAMLNAIESGAQSVLMVPTEILARQHYDNFVKTLSGIAEVKVGLLIGGMTQSVKNNIKQQIENKEINLIIGTHALFQEDVIFQNLKCVFIDEQHRFGVNQRKQLCRKDMNADVFMLSATPIPRTYEMAFYGDMDVSVIDAKPMGRKPIITSVVSEKKIHPLIESLKPKIGNEQQDTRVYWICPLVEETEKSDLMHVEQRFKTLNNIFPGKVGFVHGRMSPAEKEEAMGDFASGKTKILVATTVIEVGVDVPQATIMVIEDAQKFGLSQLHQLRGRVGRNNLQSYCMLVYGGKLNATAKSRLEVMRQSNDGFFIAQRDYELRGGGDKAGVAQSGQVKFKFFDFAKHAQLLSNIKKVAQERNFLSTN